MFGHCGVANIDELSEEDVNNFLFVVLEINMSVAKIKSLSVVSLSNASCCDKCRKKNSFSGSKGCSLISQRRSQFYRSLTPDFAAINGLGRMVV